MSGAMQLEIDGRRVAAADGMTVLEAARGAGIDIPTLCHHDELSPYGACRLCLVEVVKRGWPSIQPACLYPAQEGIEVTPLVRDAELAAAVVAFNSLTVSLNHDFARD